MLTVLVWLASAVLILTTVWVGVEATQRRRPGWLTIGGLAAGEVLSVAVTVVALVQWLGNRDAVHPGLFWGYAACCVFVLPLAFFWGIGEKSLWGNAVMALGAFTTFVLMWRMVDLFA